MSKDPGYLDNANMNGKPIFKKRTEMEKFRNNLRILHILPDWEVDLLAHQIREFYINPVQFFIRADDATAKMIWAAIEKRQPKDES